MLTARDAVQDRVAGLESGADDYQVKPFDHSELIARNHSLHRRSSGETAAPAVFSYAGLRLNRSAWEAYEDGRPLDLTSIEFLILAALMAAPGVVLSRETLLEQVWGTPDGASSNVVDVHVANLRRKVEASGQRRMIQTVRGAGYKLQLD
jgi:two-component system response regulator MprA